MIDVRIVFTFCFGECMLSQKVHKGAFWTSFTHIMFLTFTPVITYISSSFFFFLVLLSRILLCEYSRFVHSPVDRFVLFLIFGDYE